MNVLRMNIIMDNVEAAYPVFEIESWDLGGSEQAYTLHTKTTTL